MLRSSLLLIFILFSLQTFANQDKVAIVVDNTIITEKEVFDRKNFFIAAQNATSLSQDDQMMLKDIAVQSLIDEALLDEQVKKYGLNVLDNDVENFITNVEKGKKLEQGFFKKRFSINKGIYNSFYKKIRGDFIRTKINNEVLMRGISVSNSEVDEIAIKYAGKDSLLTIREFNTNTDLDKDYASLQNARKTYKNCSRPIKASGIIINSWQKKFSELSKEQKEILFDLKVGEFSAIVDKNNGLFMYQICGKKVEGITYEENDNLINYIGNKKLNFKMLKYLETIRSQAYIKFM